MTDNRDSMNCAAMGWGLSALGGLVFAAVLFVVADWTFSASLALAVAVTVIVGLFISLTICPGGKGTSSNAGAAAPKADVGGTASRTADPSAPVSESTAAAEPAAAPASAPSPAVKASAALPGQAELAARKGSWKYEGDQSKTATGSQSAPATATETVSAAASEPGSAKAAPGSGDGKPELLDAPRPEGKDDLKLISGVGPKLEETLNQMGIWHFDQVASWRKEEIDWVDERLRFKGRIERDDWVSQARILAEGGETEFSRRKNS